MNLTNLLFLSIPATLVAFKLAALALAAVWAVSAAFESRIPLLGSPREPLPGRARMPRV